MRGDDPGTVFHAPLERRCIAAVILAPARAVSDQTVLQIGGLALQEALLTVVPPQIAVTPETAAITVNGAEAATLQIARAPGSPPAWMVLGFDIAVSLGKLDPGLSPSHTDLAEEGAETNASELLELCCRHLVAWLNRWDEDGDAAIATAWQAARA